MKRIEVRLSLAVVAPLLDVIKTSADALGGRLAASVEAPEMEAEYSDTWRSELLASQNTDVKTLLALFDSEFFSSGVVGFDEGNAEAIVRASAAIRLYLREHYLQPLGDETLETGDIEIDNLEEPVRKAFMCYLFLATIQELIIQHLDSSILGS